MCFSPSGGDQTNQPSETAQEGAYHQRNTGDEGAEESKHRQLLGQVTPLL